jgi:hypothetical protein
MHGDLTIDFYKLPVETVALAPLRLHFALCLDKLLPSPV